MFLSSLKVEEKKSDPIFEIVISELRYGHFVKKEPFWPKNGHIVAKPRVRLSLPVVQSSGNIAKIIKIIEK